MTDAPKILWWSDTYWPQIGGLEILASHLVPRLAARGFDITVVTNRSDGQSASGEHDGVPIRRFALHAALREPRSELRTAVLAEISALKAELEPDIVHLTFPSPGSFFHLMTTTFPATRTICSIHSPFPVQADSKNTLMRRLLVASAYATANSNAMLADALEIAPEIRERSSVIYNGVPPLDRVPTALPFDPPTIGCIARLAVEKGVDVLLHALAIVIRTEPDVKMIVAGDGPERDKLEHLAASLGLTDRIEWLGWVEPGDIPRMLDSVTLLAVPSRTMEPFGIVAVEAMQNGRPVVCTNQGGLPEVVEDGLTGVVVPPENERALADALLRVLRDPSLASRMGKAGIARARECFGIERCVDEHEALFRSVMERR